MIFKRSHSENLRGPCGVIRSYVIIVFDVLEKPSIIGFQGCYQLSR
jgi:hypothetical protein